MSIKKLRREIARIGLQDELLIGPMPHGLVRIVGGGESFECSPADAMDALEDVDSGVSEMYCLALLRGYCSAVGREAAS